MRISRQNSDAPAVDIVTVNFNAAAFLPGFFAGLRALEYPEEKIRLIFVDNGSRDGSREYAAGAPIQFPKEVIDNGKNQGFAKANNLAFRRCGGKYIGLLNPDTVVDPAWLARLVERMEEFPDAGMAGSRQIPEESPRRIDANTGFASWCSGGHCLIRRSALDRTGGFEEKFFLYGEDVDLSWRMWLAGFPCVYVPEALCRHHDGRPEQFGRRRTYYHVRNSILIRYSWGNGCDVRRQISQRLRQAASLALKQGKVIEGAVVAAAVVGHLPLAPYFSRRGRELRSRGDFARIRSWISV